MPKYTPDPFKPDYNFPSERILVDPNEVEKGLRRKFRSEKQPSMWVLLLVAVVIATLGCLIVGRITDDQAHAATVSQEITYSSLCTQYKADMELTGRAPSEATLKEVCL